MFDLSIDSADDPVGGLADDDEGDPVLALGGNRLGIPSQAGTAIVDLARGREIAVWPVRPQLAAHGYLWQPNSVLDHGNDDWLDPLHGVTVLDPSTGDILAITEAANGYLLAGERAVWSVTVDGIERIDPNDFSVDFVLSWVDLGVGEGESLGAPTGSFGHVEDGRRIAFVSTNGTLVAIDLEAPGVRVVDLPDAAALAVAPDLSTFWSADWGRTVRRYDGALGETAVATFPQLVDEIDSLTLADSVLLVAAAEEFLALDPGTLGVIASWGVDGSFYPAQGLPATALGGRAWLRHNYSESVVGVPLCSEG